MKQKTIITIVIVFSLVAIIIFASILYYFTLLNKTKESFVSTIDQYFTERYDKLSPYNISNRMESQKKYMSDDIDCGYDDNEIINYFETTMSETVILYKVIELINYTMNSANASVEIAVAYYPSVREQSYAAVYKYSIKAIYNGEQKLITQITCNNVEYINTYGEDIHISNNKIVGIGHDAVCDDENHNHS